MKATVVVLSVMVLCLCVFTLAMPTQYAGPVPVCNPNTGEDKCIPPHRAIQAEAFILADGSDPMPLCRPTPTHKCPVLVEKPVASMKPKPLQDGGPIPLCNPNDKQCIKGWPF